MFFRMSIATSPVHAGLRTVANAPRPVFISMANWRSTSLAIKPMRKVHTTSVTQRVVPEVSPSRQTQAFPNSTSGTNTGVTPEDMLSFLNSNTFSTYQSNSSSPSTLFGKDVGLAVSALTHESWMYGAQGHNRRLAFLGMHKKLTQVVVRSKLISRSTFLLLLIKRSAQRRFPNTKLGSCAIPCHPRMASTATFARKISEIMSDVRYNWKK